MKTIVLANQKGGCCKTTTCNALALGLAARNKKVLAVDLDPQGNFSFSLGVDPLNTSKYLYDVFTGDCSVEETIQTRLNGIDVLSVGISGAVADQKLISNMSWPKLLKKALKPYQNKYDYCIVDTSPSLGLLTKNALVAADRVIIPVTLDAYGLIGIELLRGAIEEAQEEENTGLKVSGILATRYNDRLNITQVLIDETKAAADSLHTKVFDTKIRESVAVREVQLTQGILYDEAPKAGASIDYWKFVDEFLKTEG